VRDRARGVIPVGLLGLPQTRETTLVKAYPALADQAYCTFDNLAVRLQAEDGPEPTVARVPALGLKEVQRARDLLSPSSGRWTATYRGVPTVSC
jgi:hypothetical protein